MKKEKDSNIREALRSIINESKPLTDDWQKTVLAGIDAKKPRRLLWLPRVAAAAAVIAIAITAAWLYTPPTELQLHVQPDQAALPVLAEAKPKPSPTPVYTSEPAKGSAPKIPVASSTTAEVEQPEPEQTSEPIIIFDTDLYSIDPENPEVNNSIPPEEWIESLIASELANQYVTMISTIVFDEEPTNTSDI